MESHVKTISEIKADMEAAKTVKPAVRVEETKQEESPAAPAVEESQLDLQPEAKQPDEIDYKAELERTQEQLKKAEFAIYKQKKEAKESDDAPVELPPEDRISQMIEERVNARLGKIESQFAGNLLDEELSHFSKNPDEQKLIKLHYEKSIIRTGISRDAIKADLEKAYLIANAPKLRKQNTELAASMKAKQSLGNSSMGSSQAVDMKVEEDLQKQFSAYDWQWIQARKWSKEKIKLAADAKKAAKLQGGFGTPTQN